MKLNIHEEFKINILLGVFVTMLIGMNLLGTKVIPFLGLSASVAIFMYPITFLITDMIEEAYGKKLATQFVWIGVIAILLTLVFTSLFVILEPADRYTSNEAYKTVFTQSTRIMIASVVAFIVSQFHDVWAFNFWKQKTHGKYLWLRNNLSTWVSQAIDTLLFMSIAFYQVTPKFTFAFIISLAIPYYLLKIAMATIDTPFVYLGVKWLKRK
ncbi:MAG: queuosine precursor transporter [bacterium]|nr:queuosine precursor transporter [bacterium]